MLQLQEGMVVNLLKTDHLALIISKMEHARYEEDTYF